MRWYILLVALIWAMITWAGAPAPSNGSAPIIEATVAVQPTYPTAATVEYDWMTVITTHHVPERPLRPDEAAFIATFPVLVDNGSFALREAVRQMLLAGECHVNPKGFDATGRDPSRNKLHYTELYQSWTAPRKARVPVARPPAPLIPPALGELCIKDTTVPELTPVRQINCPVGRDCPEFRLPGCSEFKESTCEREVVTETPDFGLVNPGLKLPGTEMTFTAYSGGSFIAGWWSNPTAERCPPGPPEQPCPPDGGPPPDPPVPGEPGGWDPGYPNQPGDIGPHPWEPPVPPQ